MLQLATGNVFFETNPLLQKAILNPEHSLRNHHVGAVQEATGPTQGASLKVTSRITANMFCCRYTWFAVSGNSDYSGKDIPID